MGVSKLSGARTTVGRKIDFITVAATVKQSITITTVKQNITITHRRDPILVRPTGVSAGGPELL